MLNNVKINFKKFLFVQLLLILSCYLIMLLSYNCIYANSFLMGSLLMFAANFVFLSRLFFIKKQFSPSIEISIFFISEFLKLSIIAFVTIMLAVCLKLKLFPYIFGLVLLQFTMCFILILLKKTR